MCKEVKLGKQANKEWVNEWIHKKRIDTKVIKKLNLKVNQLFFSLVHLFTRFVCSTLDSFIRFFHKSLSPTCYIQFVFYLFIECAVEKRLKDFSCLESWSFKVKLCLESKTLTQSATMIALGSQPNTRTVIGTFRV